MGTSQHLDDSFPSRDDRQLSTVSDPDGTYLDVPPGSRRLLGWAPTDLVGHRRSEFLHPDDAARLETLWTSVAGGSAVTTSYRIRRPDGTHAHVEDRSRLVEQDGDLVVVSSLRIVDQGDGSHVLDPLTGLPDRALLLSRLGGALRRLERSSGALAVLSVDLDRFAVINMSLGHGVGDEVLLRTIERLTAHAQTSDTLARMGGDEFVLVVEGLDGDDAALRLSERILETFRAPYRVGTEELVSHVSIGVTATRNARYGAEELLREANLALYRAKELGRNRAELFDEALRTKAVDRLGTERLLRSAIGDGRVVVEYQPIVDLETRRVVSAEALVRIRDTDGGLLLPPSFLQVAAETDLLRELDRVVLSDALAQAAGWHERLAGTGFAGVAVNITAGDLGDGEFVPDAIARLLERHDIPAHRLQVEITEHAVVEASPSVIARLEALREGGVKVGLDDFGTGYSSLSYLRDLPVDFVKIDRSFVAALHDGAESTAILEAIIGLTRAMGLTAVAEGVETWGQLRTLMAIGCQRAQGYLFGHAGAPQTVDALVYAGPDILPHPLSLGHAS